MLSAMETLCDKNLIRQLDYQFARFIHSIETNAPEEVAFVAGLLSNELSKGNICLPIDQIEKRDILSSNGLLPPSLISTLKETPWQAILSNASCVGSDSTTFADDVAYPLVFDGRRLYLHRYWYYERFLASKLYKLAEPIAFNGQEINRLKQRLDRLFPEVAGESRDLNWQKVAVAVALTRRLSVISGGPGTGKTTTVVKLLLALIEQGLQKEHMLKIKLVAPTGKAAARLTESVGSTVKMLSHDDKVNALIPTSASTIHRLLGAIPNRAGFNHNENNRLHLDILVVDEASMVDLPLMAKLLEALPDHARLVLLGDKDQLASVEAGAVLGDICSFSNLGYGTKQVALLSSLTGISEQEYISAKACASNGKDMSSSLADSLCVLRKSYRFDEHSGIGLLAKAINEGETQNAKRVLTGQYKDVSYSILTSETYHEMISFLCAQYKTYLDCVHQAANIDVSQMESHALKALSLFVQCRLLCAVRGGEFGLNTLNNQIEMALNSDKIIQSNEELWYVGRPVMITRNDHTLGLFNGDIGITMLVSQRDETGEEQSYLKVFFEMPDGSVKAVLPSRIPDHDTAYAMTIHKSQGSEFPTTVIVLPTDFSPVLSRELIYTAVTRARNHLRLFADEKIVFQSIKQRTERLSGLKSRLSSAFSLIG
jgi:exodeoxyribonuclease V alpha subunit